MAIFLRIYLRFIGNLHIAHRLVLIALGVYVATFIGDTIHGPQFTAASFIIAFIGSSLLVAGVTSYMFFTPPSKLFGSRPRTDDELIAALKPNVSKEAIRRDVFSGVTERVPSIFGYSEIFLLGFFVYVISYFGFESMLAGIGQVTNENLMLGTGLPYFMAFPCSVVAMLIISRIGVVAARGAGKGDADEPNK